MTRSASAACETLVGWLGAFALGTILVVTAYRLFAVRDALFPGHADRAFYFDVAQHLADGDGPNIDYVWQYLVPQDHLTHYAFDYWMPLPSILMAAPLRLFGGGLPTALSVSAVLAALFAPATWWTTAALTTRRWIRPCRRW